jgi:glucose/arabinose dehydrogenase/mono/diheme cytochrome c family protein
MLFRRWIIVVGVLFIGSGEIFSAEPDLTAITTRGQPLYLAHCSICHGATGDGVPGVYPPLAKSDWLAANRSGAIRAVVNGLKDEIAVNGRTYRGQMPPIMLDDAQTSDVITFVLNSWGNPAGRVTEEDVKAVRATADFKTFAALKAAGDYRPLPEPPAGFALRELVRLNDFATRLASDGVGGKLYILGQAGGVWRFDPASGNLKQILWPKDFVGVKPVEFQTLGMVRDPKGRLWITVNQRVPASPVVMNEVAIFRTTAFDEEGDPVAPRAWFQTSYPWGIGPYNHGISDIRFGPDGMLYVSSGSRTDAGEEGERGNLGKMGEVDITAAMWRLDPNAVAPKIEVIARGIRNAYSIGWDGRGNLFTVSNGPDAHAPEEMDHIIPPKPGEQPRHHGFPYQFGDYPAEKKWYAHTPVPPPPPGTKFAMPVRNIGPAGVMAGQPTSTFNPHSSPAGIVWLGAEWPESVRNGFLVGRLGSFLLGPSTDEEHGFDVLHLKMEQDADGSWTARTNTFLRSLGRPIDLHFAGKGKLYILEYTRPSTLKGGAGWLPGRILELSVR